MSKRLIGYGYTNVNGVATLDYDAEGNELQSSGYVGQGVGNVDISASAVIDGSTFVSEPYPVFDCPVYDGDNTPTSISWSKTNNAVVTDEVVSLIASVLNTNNNPCINIPVVFKQGNTVLGTAYTDCNGDATITYTWADSDIFNVTAQVGQSLSEDITMFVKDKNNLLTYNQWSCGDYSKNLNGFQTNMSGRAFLSNEFSSNGINSIKLTPTINQYGMLRIPYNFIEGEHYIITLKCKNNINNCKLELRNAANSTTYNVTIPVNTELQEISLEFTATDETLFHIWTYNSEEFIFVDDISLITQ